VVGAYAHGSVFLFAFLYERKKEFLYYRESFIVFLAGIVSVSIIDVDRCKGYY